MQSAHTTASNNRDELIQDLVTTEDLLQLDLGASPEYVYEELEKVTLVTGEPSVLDPEFYRSRLNDVRIHMSTVAKLTAKVVRARAAAESRLNSRETRYQMQVDSRLESDAHVKGGLSVDDRKARAANPLADLRLAIRYSKNEVSSLKGMEKVISVYQKNLTVASKDISLQARLVELELGHLNRVVPGNHTMGIGNNASRTSLFARSVKEVEEQYGMSAEEAGEVSAVEPDLSIPEDNEVDLVRDAFASVNAEFTSSSHSLEVESSTEDLLSSLGVSTGNMPKEVPQAETIHTSTGNLDLTLETPCDSMESTTSSSTESEDGLSLPDEDGFDFGDTSMSFDEEPVELVNSVQATKTTHMSSSDEEGVSDDDDDSLFGLDCAGTSSSSEDNSQCDTPAHTVPQEGDRTFPYDIGIDLGINNISFEAPMQEAATLAEVAAPVELPGDMFSVVGSAEIAPSISSVFTEDISRSKPASAPETAPQINTAVNKIDPSTYVAPVVEPAKATLSDMDSLLSELGLN